jgi:hypothetical protein
LRVTSAGQSPGARVSRGSDLLTGERHRTSAPPGKLYRCMGGRCLARSRSPRSRRVRSPEWRAIRACFLAIDFRRPIA